MRTRFPVRSLRWGGLLALLGCCGAFGQAPEAAREAETGIESLADHFEPDLENQMMRAYLRERAHAALDERRERFEALETPQQIAAYQERLAGFFRETIDLASFERGPLKARVTGRLEREGYAVEKVIFESLPGFSVTGNLYLPEGGGPFPAILHPCGHSTDGKAAEAYQRVNILLARQGFVVLCYDPIGQGERSQLVDRRTGRGFGSPTGEHQVLGPAPVLLGRSLASFMIWDGMRGIDFLQSRPEVDPERIGCTGNSGGGNLTSFLMALDERIGAAAPGCFMTTTRMKNEKPGPGDPEQNLFAQTREGLDHPDFAIIRAPRPTLILAATGDFVPIEGTWDAFRQAKRIYTKLGFPERIDLVEAPEKHGFSKPLREGAVRFFARWLKGESVEVFEPDGVAVETEEDLRCTPDGQVLAMAGERSLFEINRERSGDLGQGRRAAWESRDDRGRRDLVREVIGLPEELPAALPAALPAPGRSVGVGTGGGTNHVAEMVFETEPGIRVPAHRTYLEIHSEDWPGATPIELHCLDAAWSLLSGPQSPALEADPGADRSERVVINLRDSGFSKTRNWRFHGADGWIAQMLGTSYLAMRTRDLITVARALKREGGGDRPIRLHAGDEFVPVALHAAALEPDLFESVTLHGGIRSWEEVIDSRDPVPHFHQVVHGALKHYDLPDLVELIGREKVRSR